MTLKEYIVDPDNITKHIKRRYVPIQEKKTAAEIVARVSCFDKDGNWRQDSVERYVWEQIMMIDLYTDFERSDEMYADFDAANAAGLFEKIEEEIGEKEQSEWNGLVEMACGDAVRNEYEVGGFVRRQVERFGQLAGVGLAGLDVDKLAEVIREVAER